MSKAKMQMEEDGVKGSPLQPCHPSCPGPSCHSLAPHPHGSSVYTTSSHPPAQGDKARCAGPCITGPGSQRRLASAISASLYLTATSTAPRP